ncbi:MAG: hypothetical protein ACRDP6_29220 [Actinoallomurus sp.]
MTTPTQIHAPPHIGSNPMPAKRPPVSRLLVSPETVTAVDEVRIDLMIRTRRESTKTAINDALIKVALNHLDEVAAHLKEEAEE